MSKSTKVRSVVTGLAMLTFAIAAGELQAGTINVVNPSFEIVDVAAGDNGNPSISSGWVASDPGLAYFNPDDGDYAGATDGGAPTTVPDGSTYLAFTYSGNTVTQTLSTAVTPGGEYTLSFWLGNSAQFIFPVANGGYSASLLTTGGQTVISELGTTIGTPTSGEFQFVELTGTAPAGATGNLVIEFEDLSGQVHIPMFDTVGLSIAEAVPAPEPTSGLLVVIGSVLGLARVRGRRTRS